MKSHLSDDLRLMVAEFENSSFDPAYVVKAKQNYDFLRGLLQEREEAAFKNEDIEPVFYAVTPKECMERIVRAGGPKVEELKWRT